MSHTTVLGVPILTKIDSFGEQGEYVGELEQRGVNARLVESRTARMRRFSIDTIFRTPAEGEALRKLLDGDAQSFAFDDHAYSFRGVAPKSGGSYTVNANGGKHGGHVEVASGSSIAYDLQHKLGFPRPNGWDPTKGWTLLVWSDDGGGFEHLIATGSVPVVRGDSSGNPSGVTQYLDGVAGAHGIGNLITVDTNTVALHGYDLAAAAGAMDFDALAFFPFALPATSWASALYSYSDANAWPGFPRVELDGDAVIDPITVIGRMGNVRQRSLFIEGTHYNNARVLEGELIEVG